MYSHTVVFDGFHWPRVIINRIGKLHIGRIELLFKSTGLYLYTRAIQSENLIEHSRKQCTRGRRKDHNVVVQSHKEKPMFQKDTYILNERYVYYDNWNTSWRTEMTVKHEFWTQKNVSWWLIGTVRVPVNVSKWICLCFSLFLCVRTLNLIVNHSSWFTIDRFLHKMRIFIKNWTVEQKNHCLLVNWPAWALCFQPVFRLDAVLPVDLCISVPKPLLLYFFGSTSPFGRPPSNSFILSFHLTIALHLFLLMSKTQLQKAFSLNAGALSLWHSPLQ